MGQYFLYIEYNHGYLISNHDLILTLKQYNYNLSWISLYGGKIKFIMKQKITKLSTAVR